MIKGIAMATVLKETIRFEKYPLTDSEFRRKCKETLEKEGVLVLPDFLTKEACDAIQKEGKMQQPLAYYCTQEHNVYLTPPDPSYAMDHARNRTVVSSKGCITDDQILPNSPLRALYDSPIFREFLCEVLNENALYPYADPLSSINLHYAREGQELGWHFDNSSFAITLLIQEPEAGGAFEYISGVRNADLGEMNFEGVGKILNGEVPSQKLKMGVGALVLFRGRNSIHRVTPVKGQKDRMLVVLAYNAQPGVALSESARMTFYGRLQ